MTAPTPPSIEVEATQNQKAKIESLSHGSSDDDESDLEFDEDLLEETFGSYSGDNTTRDKSSSSGVGGFLASVGKESSSVARSKALVYIVLTLAATAFGVAVYFLMKKENTDDFESEYDNYANEVLRAAEKNAEDYLGTLKSLSNTLTSYAMGTGAVFPNVTLPNFDIRTVNPFERIAGPEVYIFAPIVTKANLTAFERYAWDNQDWIRQDLDLRGLGKVDPGFIKPKVYPSTGEWEAHLEAQVHVPIWQLAPVPTDAEIVNLDLYSHPSFRRMIDECTEVKRLLLSEVVDRTFISENVQTLDSHSDLDEQPRSYAIQPVFRDFDPYSDLVGFVVAVVPWWTYFLNVLPPGTNDFVVEIQDTCGSSFFYRLDGPEAAFLGFDDFVPNPDFAELSQAHTEEFAEFARYRAKNATSNDNILHCTYRLVVHPTDELKSGYENNDPVIYTVVVLSVFALTVFVFLLYDYFVERRQTKVMATAQKTTAIVSSLFPKAIQSRIMDEIQGSAQRRSSGRDKLVSFLGGAPVDDNDNSVHSENGVFGTKPIADFFPETTLMFADIVGFTAWASTREPSQVFRLLETIYHEFDEIARRRRIFKVETVGDCYVACAGLPEPRSDHALAMGRFATECLTKLPTLLKKLEIELGPDTSDLSIRVGLHSGPVTAGVLRGERARFQLFGDTMNTASRMESTGLPNKIQLSKETADLLVKSGKGNWVVPREDLTIVKGKGHMQCYWLRQQKQSGDASSVCSSNFETSTNDDTIDPLEKERPSGSRVALNRVLSEKENRLVSWNVDILQELLKEVELRRRSTGVVPDPPEVIARLENEYLNKSENVITEVQEIITLPGNIKESEQYNIKLIAIGDKAMGQLRRYISLIASKYKDNPFHNFDHASHVTMSVVKLFSRIVAPDADKIEGSLHDHTYGITSDPLSQLAVVISALIHDVDHLGVPNAQLCKEGLDVAKHYHEKSVAEQNSVDVAWRLLMDDEFQDLRNVIYKTEAEFKRFRQLVVNSVMATDIVDKDLKELRNNRWDKAFKKGEFKECSLEESPRDHTNRKATIVIEHLVQASDVSHTMQHWHIYKKWNERFFQELYKAYLDGRADKDPSEFWYKGEIGFFDFYIIPLAKKLKDCGVFGVSSDEYLQYAINNRNEWEQKGEAVVEEFIHNVKQKYKKQIYKREQSVRAVTTITSATIATKKGDTAITATTNSSAGAETTCSESSSDPSSNSSAASTTASSEDKLNEGVLQRFLYVGNSIEV